MGNSGVSRVGETIAGFTYDGCTEIPASKAWAAESADHIVVDNDYVEIAIRLADETMQHGHKMGAATTRWNYDCGLRSHVHEIEWLAAVQSEYDRTSSLQTASHEREDVSITTVGQVRARGARTR